MSKYMVCIFTAKKKVREVIKGSFTYYIITVGERGSEIIMLHVIDMVPYCLNDYGPEGGAILAKIY